MFIKLLIISCLFCGLQAYQQRGFFTIVAPGTLRSNTDYHVSVSLDDFRHPSWFNITLETLASSSDAFIDRATIKVEPKTSKLVRFRVPKLHYGSGVLTVRGFRGILFLRRARLRIEEREYTPFIQTDKRKYQPGELVQFRVICIDRLMQPAKINESIDVRVYDSDRNLIQKFSSVKLVQGVFKGNIQLSDCPVLGEWKIEVSASGLVLEGQSFDVARYVLPNFSVSIAPMKDVAVEEGKLDINVNAWFTYSRPVNGSLALHLLSLYGPRDYSKTIEFDGETNLSLDFQTELHLSEFSFRPSQMYLTYEVRATVTETFTGESQSATAEVRIHRYPYKVELNAPRFFATNESITIKVLVFDLRDNPIQDKTNLVTVKIEYAEMDLSKLSMLMSNNPKLGFEAPIPLEGTVYLNEDGVGVVTLVIPNNELFSECHARAEYLEYVSNPTIIEKAQVRMLNMKTLSESHRIGDEILVDVTSAEPIQYFGYEIISRGDIIESKRVTVPENRTVHQFKFNVTYSMVPKVTVFAHYILNGVINSCFLEIEIERTFQNSIIISADEETLPGKDVSLNVTTDAGSYVGLLGFDERLLINKESENRLTEDDVYMALREYNDINPGSEVGLVTISNARNKDGYEIGRVPMIGAGAITPMADIFEKPVVELPRIRKMFSETWMFKDFERTSVEDFSLRESIPDTITSWAITGFSLNPKTGLSLTKNVTKLKVFREFFISMDLPGLIKQGEIIEIPVYFSNYMDQDVLTNVTIESSNEIDILDNPGADSTNQTSQTLTQTIRANGKGKVVFPIGPLKSGRYNIIARALSNQASDAIQRTLIVEPSGVPYSLSKTHLIFRQDSQEHEDDILIEVPENIVPDSESVQLSVFGSIFGPLIRSIQGLVRVPFGNSENNMRYFVSNLLVLKYFKALNQSIPSLESKAKLYLQLGYQNQMSYKHLDGSFSLFERTAERTGDRWLTAYTMWAFQQAKNYTQIDQEVINRGLNYLRSIQSGNGGFSSGGGTEDDVALSAFIMLVFLVEEENQIPYQDVIAKGLAFLNESIDDLERPSLNAISSYALVLGKHETSEKLLAKLSSKANLKTAHLEWTKPDTLESGLETITYNLMSLLELQRVDLPKLYPILQSLISLEHDKRSHAHMLALEAMIKFAQHINFESNNLTIHFTSDQAESGNLTVTESLQIIQLNRTTRQVKLRSTGTGFAVASIHFKYYILPGIQESSKYQTNLTMKEVNDWILSLEFCVATKTPGTSTHLAVMEVKLPSGYSVNANGLDRIKDTNSQVKAFEMRKNDQSLRVYLEGVSQNGTCIKLGCSKTVSIFNLKPITIFAYDFENENQRSVSSFLIEAQEFLGYKN